MSNKEKPTPFLWLVPIFCGLIGGVLMYIAVKNYKQEMANDAVFVSFISTLAWLAIGVGIWIISALNIIETPFI